MIHKTLGDIRNEFVKCLMRERFVTDKTGVKTIELVGTSFIADQPYIFGLPNQDYIERELEWYNSCSLNVNDIPGETPKIWTQVADKDGFINSNYGYLIYHPDNGYQYDRVLEELRRNPDSRRAEMIYTRPSMHIDYNYNGRSDFICTEACQYLIRNERLHVVVKMRSNDVVFGYRNDWAWQRHVLEKLATDLEIEIGHIYWCAGSLHVYEKDFYLIDYYNTTGIPHISKSNYRVAFPESKWLA